MADLSKTFLYRMTHIENIPHILQYGLTHASSLDANPNYVPIGDGGLISTRHAFEMENGNTLGEYIPFYFGPRMPMLLVIQRGYNGVKVTPARDIVYCVTSVQQILNSQLDFVFTDGHAVDKFSTYYNPDDVNNIESYLDRGAIGSKYWKNEGDLDFKRKKEAEFLVRNDIPLAAVVGYVVYNQEAKAKLEAMGVTTQIVIKPEYYF